MSNSMIEFRRPDGASSRGYLALPPRRDPVSQPGILLLQEWWGLKPHILELANRFAAEGYVVLAPDLFRGRIAANADEAQHLMDGLDFVDACDQDIAGALRHLREVRHCG
ncbi:dienelactone hydrolase family protein, partial [Pelomonas sp. KK5]|uniref:dienelactone hydrolase family protein n=1 Tax=Pelomonas sp. KK5 TaxID=1855730 RepID=UPI0018E9A0BD